VFTDLDGTLLDKETYSWDKAAPALSACRDARVPVVMVSSKTRAEMVVLARDLGLSLYPFVAENGGAVFFPERGPLPVPPDARPAGDGWHAWELGAPYPDLVAALREIRDALSLSVEGFSDLSPVQIARRTGLSEEEAALAARREYDEPFFAEEGQARRLAQAAEKKGLFVTLGGRAHHLHGNTDKGRAVARLAALFRRANPGVVSMGLGDGPNDVSMLREVRVPVWLGPKDLAPDIPRLVLPPPAGPEGWNLAVSSFLRQTVARSFG